MPNNKFTITPDIIRDWIGGRNVYIYAANIEGVGYCKLLERMEFKVAGFIDSRQYDGGMKRGKPVIHPDQYFASNDVGNNFVLIATKHRKYKKIAMEQCETVGLVKNKDFVFALDLCDYIPTVEVVGTCNLKCITCNMGLPDANRAGGTMSPETFHKVLTKLTTEIPFVNSVSLFLWGEPFMHPRLPEIINITHKFGLACDISSNMNYNRYLEKIIEAAPDILSIPCSGVGSNYEMTHTGGNWEQFKENLYSVRRYIDQYKSDTSVRLFYHMYKHNLDNDYDVVENIAKELGFYFFPILANIFPEKIYDYAINGAPLPEEMARANEMLIYSVDDHLEYSYQHRHKFCPFIKAFPTVRWNLSVVNCANMMKPVIHPNYLNVPLDQLNAIRAQDKTCGICMGKGVHRFFDVVNVSIDQINGKRTVTRKMEPK